MYKKGNLYNPNKQDEADEANENYLPNFPAAGSIEEHIKNESDSASLVPGRRGINPIIADQGEMRHGDAVRGSGGRESLRTRLLRSRSKTYKKGSGLMKGKNDTGIITSTVYGGEIYERLNPIVERITGVFFRNIDFDKESLGTLQEYAGGSKNIVYASFHSSNFSLLILYNLLRRHNFRPPVFALEYNPFLLQTVSFIWKRIVKGFYQLVLRRKYEHVFDSNYVQELFSGGKSILLSLMSRKFFLKRYTQFKYDSLLQLIEVQKKMDEPIYVIPQMIFWNMNPERTSSRGLAWTNPRDIITSSATGDKGIISAWLAVFKSVTPAFVRLDTPLNLKEEIANSKSDDSRHIALELRNRLLNVYHLNKRTILGPVIKSHQDMMERVLYHKNVLDEIARVSAEEKRPETAVRKKAYKYYTEIAATFSIVYIYLFARALNYVVRRIYDGISFDKDAFKDLREAAAKGPLVLMPCHKSHMDYLILSYLMHMNKMFPPHIAAGVNLSFFPMGTIFRHSGAFFLRRSFRGLNLYPVIFKQYVKTLISEGFSIEFFIEGGRTRTGKVVLPKLGFLSYLTEAIQEGYHRELQFVPIAINYDRILEEQSYAKELKGKEKESESAVAMLESRKLLKRKYGRVYVTFNKPLSIRDYIDRGVPWEEMPAVVAHDVVRRINEVTVVTPFALVTAAMLLSSVRGFPRPMLMQQVKDIRAFLVHAEIKMSDSLQEEGNLDEILDYVISSYMHDKIVEELKMGGGKKKEVVKEFYVLREDNRGRIVFYRNSIIHYLMSLILSSVALLVARKKGDSSTARVKEEFAALQEFFSREFIFAERDLPGDYVLPAYVLDFLYRNSFVREEHGALVVNDEKLDELKYFAKLAQDSFESYMVVLHTVLNQKVRKLTRKELMTDVRKNGVRMYHLGNISLSESLSQPNYQIALDKCREIGIIVDGPAGGKTVEISSVDKDKGLELYERIKECLEALV
jgi:glycerol-3-phosphate O-acyltransferase